MHRQNNTLKHNADNYYKIQNDDSRRDVPFNHVVLLLYLKYNKYYIYL